MWNGFINPVEIAYNQAIMVAILGLIINGASVFILGHDHNHVLADALTSLLAIVALFIAKYIGPV